MDIPYRLAIYVEFLKMEEGTIMYGDGLFIGMLIFATVLAIVGLVLVFLQKKGKVRSFTTITASGPNYIGVGKTIIVPVLLGVLLLYRYSLLWAVLYGAIFLVAYILIQCW